VGGMAGWEGGKGAAGGGGRIPPRGGGKGMAPEGGDRLWRATMGPAGAATSRFQGPPGANDPPTRPAPPPRRASSGRTEPRKKTDSSVGARPGILIPDGVLGDVEILLHVTSLGERECCRSYLRHTSIDEQFGARHVAALVRREKRYRVRDLV